MNGIWRRITKWSLGILGAAGLALIAYVVEHGELPTWLSTILNTISVFMRLEAPLAFWQTLLIFLTPCVFFGGMVAYLLYRNSTDINDFNAQCDILDATDAAMNKLEQRYKYLKSEHANLLASVHLLTSSNSELLAQNEELKNSVAMMASDTPEKMEVNGIYLLVLKAIASLTERDLRVDLDNIEAVVRLGKIQTHAALDVLKENGLISASANVRGTRYRFTAQGRVCYLELKGE
ncbi:MULTISPECIES: hypothetical protein [Pseudomonas]|uniref:hypothetical protein n=1 Tax=Pseudomonas TaxID=286 RepID=UPI00113FF758|nr:MULTISPECIES: hypothetical protein [Pseudomonas]MDR9864641.1 hypothetical protein [Pseudomonas baetica]